LLQTWSPGALQGYFLETVCQNDLHLYGFALG
jgi:hypothetical protein